jgi:hypothetical protein
VRELIIKNVKSKKGVQLRAKRGQLRMISDLSGDMLDAERALISEKEEWSSASGPIKQEWARKYL